ncbi:hypothetical protein JTB14_028799 [Gonioctena quinquepunctata]|nr:hypothetical protein JTB14_028799 [Gonioctena quinquepunctata]
MKKMRLRSHETGPDCDCKRLKCFQVVSKNNAKKIIRDFNELSSHNEQSLYLTGLISVHEVENRRPRRNEQDAKFHDNVFTYKVRIYDNNEAKDIPVCYEAFLTLHGLSGKRIQNIQKHSKISGTAPVDKRGTYDYEICRASPDDEDNVVSHIESFKGSHYSMIKTKKKKYPPESLNKEKIYELYLAGFGYPRSDTCGSCDKYQAEVKVINCKLQEMKIKGECKVRLSEQLRKLEKENLVHKKRAQTFYDRKKNCKSRLKQENK